MAGLPVQPASAFSGAGEDDGGRFAAHHKHALETQGDALETMETQPGHPDGWVGLVGRTAQAAQGSSLLCSVMVWRASPRRGCAGERRRVVVMGFHARLAAVRSQLRAAQFLHMWHPVWTVPMLSQGPIAFDCQRHCWGVQAGSLVLRPW